MKICPKCNSMDVPENNEVCPYCLYKFDNVMKTKANSSGPNLPETDNKMDKVNSAENSKKSEFTVSLGVSKEEKGFSDNITVFPGDAFFIEIRITNNGPERSFIMTDMIPQGILFVKDSMKLSLEGNFNRKYTFSEMIKSVQGGCEITTIPMGASIRLWYCVKVASDYLWNESNSNIIKKLYVGEERVYRQINIKVVWNQSSADSGNKAVLQTASYVIRDWNEGLIDTKEVYDQLMVDLLSMRKSKYAMNSKAIADQTYKSLDKIISARLYKHFTADQSSRLKIELDDARKGFNMEAIRSGDASLYGYAKKYESFLNKLAAV